MVSLLFACGEDEQQGEEAVAGSQGDSGAGPGTDAGAGGDPTSVTLDDGELLGEVVEGAVRFLKIPYAKPPVGPLRWRAPEPPESWSGVRHETEFSSFCPQAQSEQYEASSDEDCLYLNVWRPADNNSRAPVMVWIHGGGFTSGGAKWTRFGGFGCSPPPGPILQCAQGGAPGAGPHRFAAGARGVGFGRGGWVVKKITWIILFLFAALAAGCTSSDDDDANGGGSGGSEAGSGGSGEADGGEAGSSGADGGEAGSGGSGASGDELFFDCDPDEIELGLYGINCPVLDPEECDTSRRPIVIVHGAWGTADQFEALALRFASNGYCTHYMVPYDYSTIENMSGLTDAVMPALESVIDDILEATGQDQVDLVGHSMGTRVSQTFLTSSADRAAKVAHYANVEGGAADSPPGGVPSISFIGDASMGGEITGGTNVLLTGGVDHVGAAVHPKTFEEMFKFFNDGEEPATLEILPGSKILVSGKLVQFDTAQAAHTQEGEVGTIDIFEVDRDTGERVNEEPDESFEAREDGTWGPFEAKPDTYYEFQMTSNKRTDICHYYREPFIRSDAFVYLKIADIITNGITFTDDYTLLITVRNKAMWRGEDVLTVEDTEVSDNPACDPAQNNIGYFIYDDLQDGQSVMDQPIASLDALPFVNGIDYFISPEPHRTIPVKLVDRDSGAEHLVNVPSLKCLSEGVVVVQFNDFD